MISSGGQYAKYKAYPLGAIDKVKKATLVCGAIKVTYEVTTW